MPVRGTSLHETLRPYLDHELARYGELELFDAHTHIGRNDPDGFSAEPQEILAAHGRRGPAPCAALRDAGAGGLPRRQ